MFNPRWVTTGTLDEVCQDLHSHHFQSKIFLIVSQNEGWHKIDDDVWLMIKVAKNNWELYYWQNNDPRPFFQAIVTLKGFKPPEDSKSIRGISWKPGCLPSISEDCGD